MPQASAQGELTADQLIDQLASIDCDAPGLSGSGFYDTFLAENAPPKLSVGRLDQKNGQLQTPAVCVPPAMRELVRRGSQSLPTLIAHLRDARPTKLVVGGSVFNGGDYMFEYFSNEYAPREPGNSAHGCHGQCLEKSLSDKYTVRIGDVCFALIGQIVNRNLAAIRYQPTAGLIVNSPVETPELADWVKADWQNTDADALKLALLADLHRKLSISGAPTAAEYLFAYPALRRLRFYYPETYASLAGADAKLRKKFETAVREN